MNGEPGVASPVSPGRVGHPLIGPVCALVALTLLLLGPWLAPDEPFPRPGEGGWWVLAVTVLAQALAVTGTARRAVLVLVVAALPVVPALVAPGPAYSVTAVAMLAGSFLVVLARRPLTRAAPLLALAALLVAAGQAVNDRSGTALLQALVVVGFPVLLAQVVATQREAQQALRREQAALAAVVAARERTAMSRELHDIAAHHLSGIAVLAAALERLIDTDAAAARRSTRLLREQSRAVLDDLRRVVGLLREGPDTDHRAETVDAVADLVATRRAAGAEVDLVRDDPIARPGPLAQLVVYRMVQESLSNAAAHAPGARALVVLAADGDQLVATVSNARPTTPGPPGGGFGLVGMAERAHLVGGELAYGPSATGGWEVRLTVPAGEDAT